jgi:uncharacterized protein (TIGR02246 family)
MSRAHDASRDDAMIRALAQTYTDAVNAADMALLPSLFTIDASFNGDGLPTFTGREGILAMCSMFRESYVSTRHCQGTMAISVDQDEAAASSVGSIDFLQRDEVLGFSAVRCEVSYHDRFQRQGSLWRFRSRHMTIVSSALVFLNGTERSAYS